MTCATAIYQGKLHCAATHDLSGDTVQTDAPRDNGGMGAHFSPTDLVGAALLTCVLTTMGIAAQKTGADLNGLHGHVEKTMSPDAPRRIGKLSLVIDVPLSRSHEHAARLEHAALHCPVHASLHPDMIQDITLNWAD